MTPTVPGLPRWRPDRLVAQAWRPGDPLVPAWGGYAPHGASTVTVTASPASRAADAFTDAVIRPPSDLACCQRVAHRGWLAAWAEAHGEAGIGAVNATTVDAAVAAIHALGPRPWVAKAAITAAGRDRVWGAPGAALDGAVRAQLGNLLAATGAVRIEPWLARLADAGLCGAVDEHQVDVRAPHGLAVDAHGGFAGIDLAHDGLTDAERTRFVTIGRDVGLALRTHGFRGPFALDGFAYRDAQGERQFHPLCELNPRTTFGHVAWALAARLGLERLHIGKPDGRGIALVHLPGGRAAWMT